MGESTWVGIAGVLLGMMAGFLGCMIFTRLRGRTITQLAHKIIAEARDQSQSILTRAEFQSKEDTFTRRELADIEANKLRGELRERERRLEKRDELLDQRLESIHEKERACDATERIIEERRKELLAARSETDRLLHDRRSSLEKLSGVSSDQARDYLLQELDKELASEFGERILKSEEAFRAEAKSKAHEVLTTAIQRYAAAHTAEITVSTVDLPNEEMKGRIIGREGRNIRAFEKATGIDLLVDDTPGIVLVTGFDNIRREIAKVSLEKLIQDGRIHPSRIEDVVKETQEEIGRHVHLAGEQAAREAGIVDLHETLLSYLGRLKFRTSYSQNVLRHSLEVAFLTGTMAEEMGLDGDLGRRCGLLHDIGKAADHEMEGGHPAVGGELLKRFGERRDVVHAAEGHHDDLRIDMVYTVLVAAADAISASRPGARRETLEKYVKRLEELEAIVLGFPGVDQAYAIQAGREVRVLVDSEQLDDAASAKLCRDVARAIQTQLSYPGEVKVTVVRETRAVEFAH